MKSKTKSKRLSVRQKNKGKKKAVERNRKAKKDAKRGVLRHKSRRDPGIPDMHPYKEQLIAQLEKAKSRFDEDRQARKDLRQATSLADSIGDMAAQATAAGATYATSDGVLQEQIQDRGVGLEHENSRSAYFKEFKKLIEQADVILQVLDARDPLGSRCPALEAAIRAKCPDKRIVLILNKVDLVPRDVAADWLSYLRREMPTIAFKCATTSGKIKRKEAPSSMVDPSKTSKIKIGASTVLGASSLLQLLKNYARARGLASHAPSTSITVGIIGFPNVGKSSLINSLKRDRSVGTSSTPGFTKKLQTVQLDKQVALLDCPGIVFAEHATSDQLVLRNAVNIDQLRDPVSPIESLVRRIPKGLLLETYAIADYDVQNPTEFLTLVAKRRGKLLQGGIPDMEATARVVLRDWVAGKIPYYTRPPSADPRESGAKIVMAEADEFTLDAAMDNEVLNALDHRNPFGGAAMESSAPVLDAGIDIAKLIAAEEGDDEVDAMAEEEEEEEQFDVESHGVSSGIAEGFLRKALGPQLGKKAEKMQKREAAEWKGEVSGESAALNPQANKQRKKQAKLAKKRARHQEGVDEMSDDNDDYNFATDFC